jgi:peptide/nickel transport system permease protein
MSEQERGDAPAVPLAEAAALQDPGAVGLVPAAMGATTGGAATSAGAIRRQNLRLLVRSPAFLIGAGILLWWIVCALFGKLFSPYNPVAGSLLSFNQPPSGAHWFGTDSLGRDVLSRVIVGAREILIVTPLATLLGTVLGTSLGLV